MEKVTNVKWILTVMHGNTSSHACDEIDCGIIQLVKHAIPRDCHTSCLHPPRLCVPGAFLQRTSRNVSCQTACRTLPHDLQVRTTWFADPWTSKTAGQSFPIAHFLTGWIVWGCKLDSRWADVGQEPVGRRLGQVSTRVSCAEPWQRGRERRGSGSAGGNLGCRVHIVQCWEVGQGWRGVEGEVGL